jgi:hypothetical protein
LKNFTEPAPKPQVVTTLGIEGASDLVVFSKCNQKFIAFVRMKGISYESDKNRIFFVPDVAKNLEAIEYYAIEDGVGAWDRSPGVVWFSQDGKTLYAEAEDFASVRPFSLPADLKDATSASKKNGGVSDV